MRHISSIAPVLLGLVVLLSSLGCKRQNDGGTGWSLDGAPSVDTGDTAAMYDTSQLDTADSDDPPECLPDEGAYPPEQPRRGEVPPDFTLEVGWKSPLPPDAAPFRDLAEIHSVSAPTIQRDPETGNPLIAVSSNPMRDGGERYFMWGIDTQSGEYETFQGTGWELELRVTTAPPVAVWPNSGFGTVFAAHDTRGDRDEFFLVTTWMYEGNGKTTFVRPLPELDELASGRLILLPNGLYFARLGRDHLVALDPTLFDETTDIPPRPRHIGVTPATELWVGDAEAPSLLHMAGPRPGEAVALMESERGLFQWAAIDRCSETSEIFTAGPMSREILWTGEGYLVLMRVDALPGGLRPILVSGGEQVAQADFGCQHIVERERGEWACLRRSQVGFEVVTFGPDLERRATLPLPPIEGGSWSSARLDLAAEGGTLVVTGTAFGPDGDLAYAVGIIDTAGERSESLLVEPLPGDEPHPDSMQDRVAVLARDGVLAFSTSAALYAVQTHLSGLANTRHPRTLWAGNDARGYVQPSDALR